MKTYKVHYQVGTYSGTVSVTVGENAENEEIIAKAKRIIYRHGHLGMVYESFKIEEA